MTIANFGADGLKCYECKNDECNKNSNTKNCSSQEVCQISWTSNGTLQRGCGNGSLNFSSIENTYYFRCNDTDLCNNKTICVAVLQNSTLSQNSTCGSQNLTSSLNATGLGSGATWNMGQASNSSSNTSIPTGSIANLTTTSLSNGNNGSSIKSSGNVSDFSLLTNITPKTLNSTAIKLYTLCYSCDSNEHNNCTQLSGQDYSTQCPTGNICTTKWSVTGNIRRACSQNLTSVNAMSTDNQGNFEIRCDQGDLCNIAGLKCFKI
uniref:Sodefrin-like factor n=1 Tax=Acrobeloides nanus TaxID=290746 RepID=A0A914CV50_9BILA